MKGVEYAWFPGRWIDILDFHECRFCADTKSSPRDYMLRRSKCEPFSDKQFLEFHAVLWLREFLACKLQLDSVCVNLKCFSDKAKLLYNQAFDFKKAQNCTSFGDVEL